MGIFDVFKKPQAPQPVLIGSFKNTEHFRGFHRFAMEVHMDPVAQNNNNLFRGADVSGAQLDFYDMAPDRINVHLNGVYIGFICKQEGLDALRSHTITDFHVLFDEDKVMRNGVWEIRFRAHLLAKYKE